MGVSYFSRKGRMQVSRPVALTLNTLNILAPVLLLAAVILAAMARFGSFGIEINHLLLTDAAILVAISIVIRVTWGIFIHKIKKQAKK